MISQERLKEVIYYNPDTGIVKSKAYRGSCVPGDILGTPDAEGYLTISIDKKVYKLHRLLFLYMEGYIPENVVDHINRVPDDNRWNNLREVSASCNGRNANIPINNKSGVVGVCKNGNSWIASIGLYGKSYYIGQFSEFEEAVFARLAVEQCLNWSGCSSTSTAYLYALKVLKNKENY